MARYKIAWTEPALSDIDAIADFIALDNPEAARRLVQRIFECVQHVAQHPRMGKKIPELPSLPHRELVVPPCRVFYRADVRARTIFVVHVLRSERRFRSDSL